MKKALVVLLVLLFVSAMVFAGGAKESGNAGSDGPQRTVANREAADDGVSLTPSSYSEAQVPGLPYIGVKPDKKYKIAFSNGDMADSWRASFYNDMINSLDYLSDEFGCEYIVANSGADSAKQIDDIRSLLAQSPDILLFSPNEAAPLTSVSEMCADAEIPFITIDRFINAPIGEGYYIANIEGDNFRDGVAMGISIVKSLTEKFGTPKGNVAEITGAVGATPSVYRSAGIRHVLSDYPNIKIVQVLDGGYNDAMAHDAAQDIFTTQGDTLDLMVVAFDTGCGQAIEVASVMGYDDVIYVTSNGNVGFLKDYLLTGKAVSCMEYPPTYGVTTLEYAIHYLNGVDVPSHILLPQRYFMMDTPKKAKALGEIVKMCEDAGDLYVPGSYGMYDIFTTDGEMWDKYYPENYIEAGGDSYLDSVTPDDPFAVWNVK